FDDRIERCVVQRISIGGVFDAQPLRIFAALRMNVRDEHSVPEREERREITIAEFGRVMQAMKLRAGDPSPYRTEMDSNVHVDPIAPEREQRPEPDDGDRLEVE